jgi:hypothetical protein
MFHIYQQTTFQDFIILKVCTVGIIIFLTVVNYKYDEMFSVTMRDRNTLT